MSSEMRSTGLTEGRVASARTAALPRRFGEAETAALLSELERCVADGGWRDALRFLNARTRYRFTGAYRVDPPFLRNISLYDRENPAVRLLGDIHLLRETYCSIVRVTRAPFATADAPRDDRLESHPARGRFMSYCGVPLKAAGGAVWGVLCHFDLRPRTIPRAEVPLLEAAAHVMGRLMPAER